MRHRVERAGDAEAERQAEGQLRVVEHDLGQDLRVAERGLHPVGGLAEDVGHLRPGIGGGDDDLRQVGAPGNRLAEAGGRPAADRDEAVGARSARRGHGVHGDVDRGVHGGAGEDAGCASAERSGERLSLSGLLRGGEDEGAATSEPVDRGGELIPRTRAEHDPRRASRVGELQDHDARLPFRLRARTKVKSSAHERLPWRSWRSRKSASSSSRTPYTASSATCGSQRS